MFPNSLVLLCQYSLHPLSRRFLMDLANITCYRSTPLSHTHPATTYQISRSSSFSRYSSYTQKFLVKIVCSTRNTASTMHPTTLPPLGQRKRKHLQNIKTFRTTEVITNAQHPTTLLHRVRRRKRKIRNIQKKSNTVSSQLSRLATNRSKPLQKLRPALL